MVDARRRAVRAPIAAVACPVVELVLAVALVAWWTARCPASSAAVAARRVHGACSCAPRCGTCRARASAAGRRRRPAGPAAVVRNGVLLAERRARDRRSPRARACSRRWCSIAGLGAVTVLVVRAARLTVSRGGGARASAAAALYAGGRRDGGDRGLDEREDPARARRRRRRRPGVATPSSAVASSVLSARTVGVGHGRSRRAGSRGATSAAIQRAWNGLPGGPERGADARRARRAPGRRTGSRNTKRAEERARATAPWAAAVGRARRPAPDAERATGGTLATGVTGDRLHQPTGLASMLPLRDSSVRSVLTALVEGNDVLGLRAQPGRAGIRCRAA